MKYSNYLFLILFLGLNGCPAKAEPTPIAKSAEAKDTSGRKDTPCLKAVLDARRKNIRRLGLYCGTPIPTGGAAPAKAQGSSSKLIKSKQHDPKTVGDFGPLPAGSSSLKKHTEGDVPPHSNDFSTVPIEQGPDMRKAK